MPDRPVQPPLDKSPLDPEKPIEHKRDPAPVTYDEVNAHSYAQHHSHKDLRDATQEVNEKQNEEAHAETPPPPPHTER